MAPIHLSRSLVHLVGSVHSASNALSDVRSISPTHLFLEATRDVIGLIKRNPKHSPRLLDLPALVDYAECTRIPLHAIDASSPSLAHRVMNGLSERDKFRVWSYIASRQVFAPLANLAFIAYLDSQRSPLDTLIARWGISRELLADARRHIESGNSVGEVPALIESRQDSTSFLADPAYDPGAYIDLCERTGIDRRLQSVVIDYRNDYMCNQIRRVVRSLPGASVCAVVVGKNHIEGMTQNLLHGMDYVPASLAGSPTDSTKSPFMDQLLLAQLLRS